MRKLLVRRVFFATVVLILTGCAHNPHERGGNPQGLSQRDMGRDYMECEYKARLANEQRCYSQRSPFPFSGGPQSPADHALHGLSTINAMRDTCLDAKGYEWNRQFPTLLPHEDNKDPRNVRCLGIARSRSIQHAHLSD